MSNQKKLKKFFFEKTQNNDWFISPKRKNAVLEMGLKSSIMTNLDNQMSRILKKVASNFCKLLSNLTF